MQRLENVENEKHLEEGIAFLEKNKERKGVITTESGLQYEILVEGDGPKPTDTSSVTVHYHGTLIDGTVFDSSVERGQPASFGVNQVIAGWTEVLQLMPVGSKWKVFIPSEIAYGANPRPGGAIKPNMALIFEIELISID
jgi:FKBP-type peptidyl-prolyl cis-trans isomerase